MTHPSRKLTPADRYGMTLRPVWQAIRGETYKDVPGAVPSKREARQ